MTLRKLDHVLYLNARKWLDMVGITIDPEDAPMLSREAIIDTTSRDMPVIIRGFRPGPLAKSQLIPQSLSGKIPTKGGAKKKQVPVAEVKDDSVGQRIVFAIAPESNPFSKKEDIAKITWGIPMDGSAEVIIASSIVAPQLFGETFIRNITHKMLAYNPLNHSSAGPKIEVIRDPLVIKDQVLFDTIAHDLSGMAKMKTSIDPYTFWLDMHPGDVVRYMINAEDTCVQSEYRHVTK